MNGFAILDNCDDLGVVEEAFAGGEEDKFEKLIESNPRALPILEINPLARVAVPIGRQVTVGSNSIDLLFLDDSGTLIIIECKLIQNSEARRAVVAQLIEYGLIIQASWDLNRVLSIFDGYLGAEGADAKLADHLNQALEKAGFQEKLLENSLRAKIARRIKQPILVIAGNRLDQRALVLSDFLRRQKLPIACVEFRRYRIERTRFLVGYVRAASLLLTISPSQRSTVTEEEWLELIEEEPDHSIRLDLLNWAKSLCREGLAEIRIGSKELMIELVRDEKRTKVLSVMDRLWLYFLALRECGYDDSLIRQFRSRVDNILGSGKLSPAEQFASVSLSSIVSDEKREELKTLLSALVRDLKENRNGRFLTEGPGQFSKLKTASEK
jgi:hypothetical protein